MTPCPIPPPLQLVKKFINFESQGLPSLWSQTKQLSQLKGYHHLNSSFEHLTRLSSARQMLMMLKCSFPCCWPSQVHVGAFLNCSTPQSIHPTKSAQLKEGVDLVCKDVFSNWQQIIIFEDSDEQKNWFLLNDGFPYLKLKWQIHEKELDWLSKFCTIVLVVWGRHIIRNVHN